MSGTTGSSGGGTSQVLREFVMRLGYTEDESSRRKFGEAIKSMTLTVASLGAAMVAAAAGVIAGVRGMANSANELYFISQRTKSSARDIEAMEVAFTNLGGSAGQARAALEKLGDYVRASPGNVKYLEALTGKQWTDAATGMEQLSEAFKKQIENGTDISVVFAEARAAGLSESDVLVLLQKDFKETMTVYRNMADNIIGDSRRQQEIVDNAHEFTKSYNELEDAINLFARNFGDQLNTKLKPDIDNMKKYLEEHSEDIKAFLEATSKVIVHVIHEMVEYAIEAGEGLEKLREWYKQLTPEGQNAAWAITGVAGAIVLLNTAIGKSPLVRMIALGVLLFELYKDYQKWKETGKEGFIDWERWEPGIIAAKDGITVFATAINEVVTATTGWTPILVALAAYMAGGWLTKMIAVGAGLTKAWKPLILLMAAVELWESLHRDSTPEEWSIGSPNWRGLPVEEQLKYPNSPESQKLHPTQQEGAAGWLGSGARWLGNLFGAPGSSPGSVRGVRNNNPTNLTGGNGAIGLDPAGFGVYSTMEEGIAAGANQILINQDKHGLNTIEGMINRWAPPGSNDTEGYIKAVSEGMGVPRNQPIDAHKKAIMEAYLSAITQHELGRGHKIDPATIQRGMALLDNPHGPGSAGNPVVATTPVVPPLSNSVPSITVPPALAPSTTAGAGGGGSADDNSTTVHQTNHVTITGGLRGDPREAAALISAQIGDKTAQAARNSIPNIV